MILLDGLDKHEAPLADKNQAGPSLPPVARAHTPTPSLPDYEASQAQLKPTVLSYPEIQEKRTRRRNYRRYALYALVVYFVISVAIGVPFLVIKLKKRAYTKANASYPQPWSASDNLPPQAITLGDAPLRLSSARSCNAWSSQDVQDGSSLLQAELEYHVPVNGSLFLNTNITYSGNGTYLDHFSGQLIVGLDDDLSATDATVRVSMHYTTPQLRNATNVCMMQTGSGGGLYLFTPKNMTETDSLHFNITLLLPRNNGDQSTRNIPQLLCHLPHFQHIYQSMDPYVTFGSVVLGGAMAGVEIESIQASDAVVKASSAEIRGQFTVGSSLSLETVSAPINADIRLFNNGTSGKPTYMHLTTGNNLLNATVTMFVPPEMANMTGPHFLTHAETFNAPLTIALMHDPASAPAVVQMRALNNLGNSRVSVDSRYEGTFDVSTMFAQADVLTKHDSSQNYRSVNSGKNMMRLTNYQGADSDDSSSSMKKPVMYLASPTTTSSSSSSSTSAAANQSRCLEYDLISSSEIRGWVGIPPRAPPPTPSSPGNAFRAMGHIDVVSSLSGAQLMLLT
ncbi:uncharacterized protein TRAVEDRAFT_142104 [Trametes versicolor FP-101664 SS1]|uniref:uncharacterized protein n=1 Tax=Trametes versicolor (strain FP-101664) TaxID=717944 RepID=UPI00046229EF|nr:uncharacterized protein TRAVEDRAFT_142104 [Trametes versicolor FP-101664 SS1]EIW63319.1 hypothetical protein TRAVEDRAFT_142104 [Trametes versicolor FP-101664 SS1]